MTRLLLIRLPPGVDLVEQVERLAAGEGVEAALVRGGPGSLMHAGLYAGGAVVEVPGPAVEVLTLVGEVRVVDGRMQASLHGAVGDMEGRVYAGRFVRGRCPVCVTVEMVLEPL